MKNNQAFIDGQNLNRGTISAKKPWKIDLCKFRVFLSEKYGVKKAYYFVGTYYKKFDSMYRFLEKAGYIVIFREHAQTLRGKKKGNVDSDIVFYIMDAVYRRKVSGKIVLVSGDGDYKKMVTRLVADRKFRVIIFPNSHWSSLYKSIEDKYKVRLYAAEIRKYLELKK